MTRDRELAAEAVQDAFVCVLRTYDSYRADRGEAGPWIRTIVHHRAVDLIRRDAKRHQLEPLYELAASFGEDDSPEDQILRNEESRRVRKALQELTLVQRQVLVLSYYCGYTCAEIAGTLNIPIGTVKTRTMAAKRELRRLLAPTGPVGTRAA